MPDLTLAEQCKRSIKRRWKLVPVGRVFDEMYPKPNVLVEVENYLFYNSGARAFSDDCWGFTDGSVLVVQLLRRRTLTPVERASGYTSALEWGLRAIRCGGGQQVVEPASE